MLLLVLIAICVCYSIWSVRLLLAWHTIPSSEAPPTPASDGVSIVVAARNEASHLPKLIADLKAQRYLGAFEVIVVDDHSTDSTAALVAQAGPPFRLIRLIDNQGKKHALEAGIEASAFPVILCTDADCRVGPAWLAHMMQSLPESHAAALGPVAVAANWRPLQLFQLLDQAGMMVYAGGLARLGKPVLANGGNLMFRKDAFREVGGYAAHIHRSSGDDVLLISEFQRRRKGLCFVKDPGALVTTAPVASVARLWAQRVRWAGKLGAYQDRMVVVCMTGVWMATCSVIASAIVMAVTGDMLFLVPIGLKFLSDLSIALTGLRFAGQGHFFAAAWAVWPFHQLYLALAPLGIFARTQWKGRPVQ